MQQQLLSINQNYKKFLNVNDYHQPDLGTNSTVHTYLQLDSVIGQL